MNNNLKKILQTLSDGKLHSGAELGKKVHLTRSAIWKLINHIRELDITVTARTNLGYRLSEPIELLDKKIIAKYLKADKQKNNKNIIVLDQIPSTNTYLQELHSQGNSKVAICLAERQTMGRGRLGRAWYSPFGKNLYMSVMWNSAKGPNEMSGICLVVALAIIKALVNYGVNANAIGIKWPNDIFWHNRKLAGILTEISGEAYHLYNFTVGIGLNLNMPENASKLISQPWVNLAEILQRIPERNKIAGLILNQVLESLRIFQDEGLTPFLKLWQKYDISANKNVTIITPAAKITGIGCGIDQHGYFLLKTPNNVIQKFAAGEVSLRNSE